MKVVSRHDVFVHEDQATADSHPAQAGYHGKYLGHQVRCQSMDAFIYVETIIWLMTAQKEKLSGRTS